MRAEIQALAQSAVEIRPHARRSGSWRRNSEELAPTVALPPGVDREWEGRARLQGAAVWVRRAWVPEMGHMVPGLWRM